MTIPILIALAFASLATIEWRRVPLVGRVHLAAATGFALAAIDGAGTSVVAFAGQPRDGVGYLVSLVGAVGLAAVVASAGALAFGAATVRR